MTQFLFKGMACKMEHGLSFKLHQSPLGQEGLCSSQPVQLSIAAQD